MTATLNLTTAAVNDVVLHVREWGAGDPPLLLLHGYIGSALDWVDVAPALATDRRVVAYDHRGHGDSTNAGVADAYTFVNLAADLAAFIDQRETGSVDLLGHSMGGVVAMMYVIAHPERVRSLVLMDTAAAPARAAGDTLQQMVDPLIAVGREQGMAVVAEIVADFADSMPRPEGADLAVLRQRAIQKFSALDVEALQQFALELGRYPSMLESLSRLTCPVTVIVGANDDSLRPAADDLAAAIPGARLEVIEGAGHSPQEDRPDAWMAAVRRHLQRVEAGR